MDENIVAPKNEESKSHTLAYSIAIFLLVVIGFIIGAYNSEIIKSDNTKTDYVKKDNVDFNMLSLEEQNKYMRNSIHLEQLDRLNKQIKDLKKSAKNNIEKKPKIIEKIVKIKSKPKVIEKIIKVKEDCKEQIEKKVGKLEQLFQMQQKEIKSVKVTSNNIDKTKYKTYTCKDMLKSDFYISKNCNKMIHKFLDKNKNSKMFEVIGVVGSDEFKLSNKISDFAKLGLAHKRVTEGKWAIKYHLGHNTNVQVVNYIITSKKKYKGFVVRAYK